MGIQRRLLVQRDTDVVVIGAGVVGLAAAAALSRAGREVVVLERHGAIARETTSRNSEVIHAGIYYPEGSLKARLCVAGRELLYERCEKQGIPHRAIGKLIVATREDEIATLEMLQAKGTANGVPDLRLLDASEVRRREPHLRAVAALESPVTGIVDGHALCLSYQAEAESHGALLVLHTTVSAIEALAGGYRVVAVDADGGRSAIDCGAVVNAAGLESDRVAACAGLDVEACGYRLHPCKGDYFTLAPGAPVALERLVYPVPAGAGLGIHATLDLGGRIRFGPDTEYVDAPHYRVDAAKAEAFAHAIRRYLPDVQAAWLAADYAGVRPKLSGAGEPFRDFVVAEESAAGLPGFVSCIGIESPGLTAAGAIARRVVELLAGL
jgi:L-2-hydroxyglutarate oxidase LhgO